MVNCKYLEWHTPERQWHICTQRAAIREMLPRSRILGAVRTRKKPNTDASKPIIGSIAHGESPTSFFFSPILAVNYLHPLLLKKKKFSTKI